MQVIRRFAEATAFNDSQESSCELDIHGPPIEFVDIISRRNSFFKCQKKCKIDRVGCRSSLETTSAKNLLEDERRDAAPINIGLFGIDADNVDTPNRGYAVFATRCWQRLENDQSVDSGLPHFPHRRPDECHTDRDRRRR
jgi:hypothetical protein